jgi:hypothetical protein
MDIHDRDLEDQIRKALAANPMLAERTLRLMVRGAEKIEEFEQTLDQIKALANKGPVTMAAEHCRECVGDLIDVFSDLMDIATGEITEGDA